MANSESGFQLRGSGPEAYERYMVPIHCMTLAEDLIGRVKLQPREHVLDVACGTGIVSRYAALRVGSLGHVTGVELNSAMIDVARKAAAYFDQPDVTPNALTMAARRAYQTLLKRANDGARIVKITPHKIRHFTAVYLLNNGCRIEAVVRSQYLKLIQGLAGIL